MFDADRTRRIIKDIPNNWAFFYDADGVKQYCKLTPEGNIVDVGQSDVYARTCGYDPVPGVADYTGPIQAITFVVPAASSQRAISAEAAHLVFGAGGSQGAVPPWIDPRLFFVRSPGTGTIQLTSRAINVPANAWWGIDRLSSDNLRDSMEGVDPASAELAVGVLSSDFADQARDNLRILAFQGAGQSCGYLPDSTADLLRQGERARRPLPDLGADPPLCPDDQRRPLPGGRRPGHPLLGPPPRAEADRSHHRGRLHPRLRDARETQSGDGPDGLLSAAVRLRLLLRQPGQQPVTRARPAPAPATAPPTAPPATTASAKRSNRPIPLAA